jgi:succinate dehydrogenase/fumarate reductase iron-sulfur protein
MNKNTGEIMGDEKWNVTFAITRKKGDDKPFQQSFSLEVNPDEYVLDGIERIWAFADRSLVYRHACHHSTCGACGMRVNGVEKLTCITTIRSVTSNGGTIHVEPLRNFPVLSDLVVDMGQFYLRLEQAHFTQVAPVNQANLGYEKDPPDSSDYERLVDCIECGCCVSACPVALTSPTYLGPAALAAVQHSQNLKPEPSLYDYADQQDGVWRCHSAFECTAVCPSNVDPGWRIMDLRKRVVTNRIGNHIRKIFGGR